MLRERGLKIVSVVAVAFLRMLFKMPHRRVAKVIKLAHLLASKFGAPPEVLSDIDDARKAMEAGPPLGDSIKNVFLKSDPELLAHTIYKALSGDRPLGEINPW